MPPSTAPPSGGWPGVALEGVRQGGAVLERYQDGARDRPPRPGASTLSIVNTVALAFVVIGVVAAGISHQLGAEGYDERQRQRHEEVMSELKRQRASLYDLIDTVAEHHPEAARASRHLERGSVRP